MVQAGQWVSIRMLSSDNISSCIQWPYIVVAFSKLYPVNMKKFFHLLTNKDSESESHQGSKNPNSNNSNSTRGKHARRKRFSSESSSTSSSKENPVTSPKVSESLQKSSSSSLTISVPNLISLDSDSFPNPLLSPARSVHCDTFLIADNEQRSMRDHSPRPSEEVFIDEEVPVPTPTKMSSSFNLPTPNKISSSFSLPSLPTIPFYKRSRTERVSIFRREANELLQDVMICSFIWSSHAFFLSISF